MSEDLRREIGARRRIYLLRHGEVSYFDRDGKPYPQQGVPLNHDGLAQAEAARKALSEVPIDRFVHTGYPRALETAGIIARGHDAPIEVVEALGEIRPGPFSKNARAPGFESYFTAAFASGITRESTFLGGESYGEFEDRVVPAFRALLGRTDWKHIAIVAHGGTNRLLLLHALGASLASLGTLEQEPGCINVIDVHSQGRLLVRQANFTPYSPLKAGIWATTLEKIYLDHFDGIARLRGGESA